MRGKEYFIRFCLAVAFFSRLPIPAAVPFSPERLNRASAFFALVGTCIGILVAVTTWVTALWWPLDVAVLLGMLFSLRLTGAFHEDGLADMADGLGGGLNTERKLAIMKDSRLGTYGAVSLFGGLLLKWQLLVGIGEHGIAGLCGALIGMHTVSRAIAGSLIADTPYVRAAGSKAKPLAERQSCRDTLFLLCSAGAVSALLFSPLVALLLWSLGALFHWSLRRYLLAQLGGFTGDCLGAGQQIMELIGYLALLGILQQGGAILAPWLEGYLLWPT
ncbi:adenosylcobinamide-GDP ribazoletransferase [Pseudaeromonas sharmana]|uniref:Adenosylcobinamide-GDP ribazoletransferase n=1 Tax=Pseudaeromonas sharmana TaxID=328412 RepID=A0ABV8CQ57_9GAMM